MTAPFYDESTVNSPMEELFLLSCYTLKHSLKKEEKKKKRKEKLTKNHISYVPFIWNVQIGMTANCVWAFWEGGDEML